MNQSLKDFFIECCFRANFFYADYGLVASTDPVWLQRAFDTLTGMFERVKLRTNVWKTV